MDINWLGHSCFRIKGSHVVVMTDPFPPDLGYSLGKQTARLVTVSHQHPSHSYVQGIEGSPRAITGPGEYEISNIVVIGVGTYHDGANGKERGKNTVFVFEIDGVLVCHLGDLGHTLTAGQKEEIDKVDVLLLPVGGGSALNASMAAEVVRQLEPKIVVPMHYKTPALKRELDPVEKFLKEMGSPQLTPQPKLSVTRANLPLKLQVTLLEYAG
ncbi:MAG: MBL fold metallo-hydrolase [Dehalococcoidales bacterium]|nr:MBL fold metallo-hydrolase [Dehalococcoidales bacterium]